MRASNTDPAPACKSSETISAEPVLWKHAKCNGVQLNGSHTLTSAPWEIRNRASSTSSHLDDRKRRRHVDPSAQTSLTAPTPAFLSHDCTTARSPRPAAAATFPGTTIVNLAMRTRCRRRRWRACDKGTAAEPNSTGEIDAKICTLKEPPGFTRARSSESRYQGGLCKLNIRAARSIDAARASPARGCLFASVYMPLALLGSSTVTSTILGSISDSYC